MVNYRGSVDAQGKRAAKALSEAELVQVNSLVKEAMGFSTERGDSLNVVNSPFASDTIDVAAALPEWRQPDNIELAKTVGKYLLLGLLALYAWFGVLRPLLRKHLQPEPLALPLTQSASASGTETLDPAIAQAQLRAIGHQANVQHAQDAATKDPRMVAMLIKHWMKEA